MIDKKILFGISLKKAASSITLSKVNYTIRPTASFDSIYAKSFDSLDVWMYTKVR